MTAAELHALVAPLWERCPELRPAIPGHRLGLYPHAGYWCWIPDGSELGARDLDDTCAAALIRVAIEDWLYDDFSRLSPPFREADGGWYIANGGERGPTKLHALVATAHAVLDAKATV